MELKDKIKLIRKAHGYTQAKFAENLDIAFRTFQKYELGNVELSMKAFLKISEKYPQYALWLTTTKVAPEIGQIAPGDNAPQMGSAGVPAELLNSAFEKTITASIALGWLSAKPDIKFSMLADLLRHDFVAEGGKLIEQAADESESKTG
ncbi:MAG: transcriptional regulator with XRE-family HTH domain [Moritella sp.]|jgi:transcriptional regulator with XRE-family HTH domain